jgi:hypothetical protein
MIQLNLILIVYVIPITEFLAVESYNSSLRNMLFFNETTTHVIILRKVLVSNVSIYKVTSP